MGTPAVGALAKLGFGATATVDEPVEFLSESLRATRSIIDGSGIRGTRSHQAERTREGTTTVSGTITMNPSPQELSKLLPKIFGANESTGTFALAETLPEFYVSVDRITKVFTYGGCKVSRAVFSGGQGQLLTLALDIVGKSESVGSAGSFPAISPDNNPPFCFTDLVLTLLASARSCKSFELTIDNGLQTDRFMNSKTLTEIPVTDRTITLRTQTPYTPGTGGSGETDLYLPAVGGIAANATFTNGGMSLALDMAAYQVESQTPVVGSKGEIMLDIVGTCRKSGSTAELVTTLDYTP